MQIIKRFVESYWHEILGVLFAIVIVNLPLICSQEYWGRDLDPQKAAAFGDFVGGYIGTIFVVLGLGFVSATFRNQKSTNEQAAVESRFFELLQYHRDNVNEIKIEEVEGRRAFVCFLREWRMLRKTVERASGDMKIDLEQDEKCALAYLAFFNGSGKNSRRVFENEANARFPQVLVEEILQRMTRDWRSFCSFHKGEEIFSEGLYEFSFGPTLGKDLPDLGYIAFGGHQSRLAHYFRHLYQILKYISERCPSATKQEYADLVKAQLTTHEQALLYLHQVTWKKTWQGKDYFEEFKMTSDIPAGLFANNEVAVTHPSASSSICP